MQHPKLALLLVDSLEDSEQSMIILQWRAKLKTRIKKIRIT
jgi:hypothetical protein